MGLFSIKNLFKPKFPFNDVDFLIIFLPLLAAGTLFLLVISDKMNLKLFRPDYIQDLRYNKQSTKSSAAVQDVVVLESIKRFDILSQTLLEEPGFYGLYIKDLRTDTEFRYNDTAEFYSASLYKLPIAAAVLKRVQDRKISLEDKEVYLPLDYSSGTGVVGNYSQGIEIKVSDLLTELIKNSDNTAQNILLRTTPLDDVEKTFRQLVPDDSVSTFYRYNLSSPYEISQVIYELIFGSFLNDENKAYLKGLMINTSFEDRITPGLKKGLVFAHKIGSWPDTWHDCGVIYSENSEDKAIVCLMSSKAPYENFLNASKATAEFLNSFIN